MEKTTKAKKTKGQHGGARPGSGRPKGTRGEITIKNLMEQIHKQANGREYEELLVEDFMAARADNDKQLMVKYHHLILNKVMSTMAKVEVTDSADAVEAKKAAFAAALAKLTGVKEE